MAGPNSKGFVTMLIVAMILSGAANTIGIIYSKLSQFTISKIKAKRVPLMASIISLFILSCRLSPCF